MTKTTKFILTLVCIGICNWSTAQTCCSAGAPITSSFDIGNESIKSLSLHLQYEYNSVNRLINLNERLTNDPRSRNSQNALFKTDYVVNKHWAISMFIPVVWQTRTTFSENETAGGLGDLTLITQYSTKSKKDLIFKVGGGVKIPTGHQYISSPSGITLSPDMQSGSGTYDFIGRAAIVKQHFLTPNFTNQTSISYRYNTTNDHFGDPKKEFGRQFKFGNETQLTTAFSYLMIAGKWFIIPNIGFQVRHTAPNEEQRSPAFNSGGYWLNLPIGIQIQPNEKFSFRVFGLIPVKEYLEGLQITTNYRAGVQFSYTFQKNADKQLN